MLAHEPNNGILFYLFTSENLKEMKEEIRLCKKSMFFHWINREGLYMKPSDECMRKISDAFSHESCPTQNALYRRGRLMSNLKLQAFRLRYNPSAFLSEETRRRETGIFSSTPSSVSNSVPPDCGSTSFTSERLTREPRWTRKKPWPSSVFRAAPS